LIKAGDKTSVWQVKNNAMHRVELVVGPRDARTGYHEVRSGLSEGDVIVRSPGSGVKEGQMVEMLAAKYGWSLEQARQATSRVAKMAENEGLSFDMDNTKVINSFDAHRFTHLAKKHARQNEAEEKLFSAHFCEGKSTADHETLVSIGSSIGLPESEVRAALASDAFSNDVRRDIVRARELGVTGVPFFVFNGKLAVSGAQGSEVFLKALSQAALG
jgi:predicted DsbA family dithiol-disulfide isomerase